MSTQSFKPSVEMTFATVKADSIRFRSYSQDNSNINLLIDLSDVNACDSAGLALLIEAKRLSKKQNKQCKIEKGSNAIQALAQFCGVGELLELEQ